MLLEKNKNKRRQNRKRKSSSQDPASKRSGSGPKVNIAPWVFTLAQQLVPPHTFPTSTINFAGGPTQTPYELFLLMVLLLVARERSGQGQLFTC